MDLLSKRYASPFLMLDDMIRLEMLHDFVIEVINAIHTERDAEDKWQYYLHKVHDKSYQEFLEELSVEETEDFNVVDVVNETKSMIDLYF